MICSAASNHTTCMTNLPVQQVCCDRNRNDVHHDWLYALPIKTHRRCQNIFYIARAATLGTHTPLQIDQVPQSMQVQPTLETRPMNVKTIEEAVQQYLEVYGKQYVGEYALRNKRLFLQRFGQAQRVNGWTADTNNIKRSLIRNGADKFRFLPRTAGASNLLCLHLHRKDLTKHHTRSYRYSSQVDSCSNAGCFQFCLRRARKINGGHVNSKYPISMVTV